MYPHCPNKNLPQWKELVEVVGENQAYCLWDQNNGNPLDQAPNGQPSKLFSELLINFNGDRNAAIQAKAKVYSQNFKTWFGDWLSEDKTNVSKVVDENGEPLMVYHGGAKDITEFRISSEEGNTDRGYYTDKDTGEKIPVDSARSIFFSDNKYVGVSYGTLLAIQTYQSLLSRVNSLLYTVHDNEASIDQGVFKTFDYFYDTLTALTEFNPRFERLREYIKSIKKQGKRLNPKEIQAFRDLLLETRKELEKVSSDYLMNRPDWENVLDVANKVIKQYSTEEGVKKLKQGEIPKQILKEWELYKKIEKQREKHGMPKIGNYETLHLSLSKNGRYYMVYDGDKIRLWTPDYSDPYIEDLTEEQIKDFLDEALQVNEANIETLANEEEYSKLRQHYQLYPVFLNIKNPLVHDYEGTHQGQGYKQSPTNSFGYVAARQVNKAIKDGNDGVVFENIYDPILANNYAVFNPNQIKSIDNRGTFSTKDNNMYNSLKNTDIYEVFKNQKLIHNNRGYFINKYQYNSPEELNSLVDYITQESYKMGYYAKFIRRPLSTRVLFTKRELLDKIPESPEYTSVREIITFLCDRFPGLKFGGIVSQKNVKPNQRAFIENDTIYLVEGRFTDQIAIEEAIHPFINTLYHTNRELFDNLYEEVSREYPKLKADIERNYSKYDAATKKQELVAQAFSRAFNEQFTNNKPSKLKDVLIQFIEWIRSLFTDDVVSTYGDINYISTADLPKMTLSELVQLIHTSDTYFDVDFNGTFNSLSEEDVKEINKTYEQIQRGLKNRLNSVKHYTTKNPKLWNQLSTLINHLQNSEAEQGIIQFIEHLTETIQDSQKFLDDPNREITLKQITQLSKDYVGFYKPLIDEILYLLDTTDIFKDLDNYQQLADTIRSLQANFTNLNNRFINIKKSRGKRLLVQYLQEHGMPQDKIDGILQWLDNPDHDDSIYMTWFGMASNDNNAILQTIAKMLNDVSNSVSRSTMDVGIHLTKLVQEAKKKYGNDVQKLLYERLDDGKFSGNIVKPINYGQYQKDKREYLDKLAKELGIKKDSKGMYQLPNDEETLSKWYDGLNKFYSKRVNRRFKPEYYDLRNRMLSLKTRNAIDEIQDYIDSIEQTMTVDGVQYENLLTESEYNQLLQLRKQKQLLAIPYNIDGTPKTGNDLLIAQELTAFNKAVEGKVKYIQSDKKYIQERAKIVKKYGEGSKELKLWEERNTVLGYSQDIWDSIDSQAFFERQSDTYKELVEKRRQLRKMYADPKTGEINPDTLSDKEKQMLVQLDQDIANSVQLEQPLGMPQYSIKRELNEQYYRDFNKAKEAGEQAFNEWYQANHYEDLRGVMQPASYYTTLSIVDNYNKQLVEKQRIPSNKFSEISPMSEYYNKGFDQNGPSIQPKKEFYDNSKAYRAVMDKPEVKALYDSIEKYMREANSYIAFVNNVNDTRMPQIPARYMQVISRQNGVLGALKYTFDELVTTQPDDMEFVEEHEYMPNGDPIRLIPTRFIKRLDDPNTISTDAVASVVAYYNMAVNFREMSNQQDKVELMLSLLKDITIRNKKGVTQPGASRLYQRAQLLIDRLMYGRETTPITKEILGKEVNISKLLNRVRSFIVKVNLSGNLWSIATSFFTDATYTTMEAKLGRFFTTEDLAFAVREYGRMLPDITANIGNPVPTNKLGFLMLLNQVVKDNRETFDRLDQSQVLRSLNQNFWYLGYTQSDYAVKSHTLMSIYHNYRFVKGEGFMSKSQFIDKFYANDRKKGDIAFRQLQVTLYDAYEKKKDGSFGVKDEYSKYVTEKLQNDVKNRIDILSRRIDGTLRDVDKAAVHANSWAAYLVMHKNFMIQGLHDRFKKEQYNLDLGVVEKGYYRVVGGMLSNMFKNNGFSIKQLMADYNQMSDYEQYAVRRVLYDLILITASTTLAVVIASLVDGDDDYDNWVTQSVAYLAMRSAFEFRTMYNPMEFFSMIKSPSAAFTTLDNASAFIDLVNPFAYTGDRGPFTIIDRGVYEGMPRILRNMIKVTPIRSIIEAQDPKSKRSYLENQLMSF